MDRLAKAASISSPSFSRIRPVIHKDTGQLAAKSPRPAAPRTQNCPHRRFQGQEEDPAASHPVSNLTDRGAFVIRHAPGAVGPAYLIARKLGSSGAILCMADLRMKLDAIKPPRSSAMATWAQASECAVSRKPAGTHAI